MKSKWILALVIFLLLALNANALVSDLPNSITFFEEEKTLEFKAENNSGEKQELKIKVYSPLSYEIKGEKSFLENGETALIEITFFPNKKLLNSVYESTVLIELGREIKKENITMYFEKEINYDETEELPPEEKKEDNGTNVFGLTGNVFLAELGEILNPVNLFLIVIAAVLMLLFISRLTKRLNKEGKQ